MTGAADFICVIPARYASTRFPGKVLAPLDGCTVLQHVYRNASDSGARDVLVATENDAVATAAADFGARVVMTSPEHASGTDRVAEVAAREQWGDDQVIVNVQGDAPLLPAASIRTVAELLAARTHAQMATLCTPLVSASDYADPNVVKVVMDQSGRALYFSRSPLPAVGHGRAGLPDPCWRHLGIYAYRVSALRRLTEAAPCYLETSERLEQLRALWLGMTIQVGTADEVPGPDVDTPEDLAEVDRVLRSRG